AVDTPNALLNVHRVPWQVVVEKHARKLQVDTFAPCCRADQYARSVRAFEAPFGRNLGAVVTSFQDLNAGPDKGRLNRIPKRVHASKVGRKDDDFLVRMHRPEIAKSPNQLLCLALWAA